MNEERISYRVVSLREAEELCPTMREKNKVEGFNLDLDHTTLSFRVDQTTTGCRVFVTEQAGGADGSEGADFMFDGTQWFWSDGAGWRLWDARRGGSFSVALDDRTRLQYNEILRAIRDLQELRAWREILDVMAGRLPRGGSMRYADDIILAIRNARTSLEMALDEADRKDNK